MKVFHVREGKEMKIPNALTFMANDRVLMTDAVAGDIIGIYNHGQLHIGDTLTQGEVLGFTGIPILRSGTFPQRSSERSFQSQAASQGLEGTR